MSVDRTIEELSGTLAQLGILVEHINAQMVGISSRINLTLDNFDHAVAGIATDAGLMTGKVGETVSQVPHAWVFYMLFISLFVVLALLSILIIINLIARIYKIIQLMRNETKSRLITTPLSSMVYSESKQPLNISYPASPQTRERLRHIAVPMEAEPKRFGSRTYPTDFGTGNDNTNYASPSRMQQSEISSVTKRESQSPHNLELNNHNNTIQKNQSQFWRNSLLNNSASSSSIVHTTRIFQQPQQLSQTVAYISSSAKAV